LRLVLPSNQMRRFVPVLLCLVLLFGGLCSGLCFAQTPDTHACCHGKNHCGSTAPSMQSHQPIATMQPCLVILAEPAASMLQRAVCSHSSVLPLPAGFIPPLRTSVLRL
jgi:hypothetical protein